jgi:hypothetical protein
MVVFVAHTLQQTCRFSSLSQLDDAVVADVEQLSGIPDRGACHGWMTPHDEQQLM